MFQQKFLVFFYYGRISFLLKKKKACIVIENKQEKCLQVFEVHMQFWLKLNISIPPITQLQNPLFFHSSLLMAVELSRKTLAWQLQNKM